MPTATPDLATKLDDILSELSTVLAAFFVQPDALTLLSEAFNSQIDASAMSQIVEGLDVAGLDSLISLELVSKDVLGGTAAYIATTNTVYLAEEFLATALPDELIATLLQQVGYVVDDLANDGNTAGNEGAIFEALVTGQALSPEALATLQAETKHVQQLAIEDAVVTAEFSVIPAHMTTSADLTPMQGGQGRDRLQGNGDADDMFGGQGRDRLRGEGGDDQMDGGAGRDRMHGGEGADVMTGGGGRDVMKGGLGDDLLNGGAGRDRLQGGEGTDTFVYESMKDGGDLIRDFEVTMDVMDVSTLLSELGYGNSTFDSLINDVIVLGQAKRGARVGIDPDGLAGEARPRTLAGLKGIETDELTGSNFIVAQAPTD